MHRTRWALKSAAACEVDARFDDRPPRLRAALSAMRPHQWAKNVLVFVPSDHGACGHRPQRLVRCPMHVRCLLRRGSGIYLLNDLSDLAADRQHPRKRRRPFASGALPLTVGAGLAGVLLGIGSVSPQWSARPSVIGDLRHCVGQLLAGVERISLSGCVYAGRAVHDTRVRRRRGDRALGVVVAAGLLRLPVPRTCPDQTDRGNGGGGALRW